MKRIIKTFLVGIIVSLFSITTHAVNVPYTFSANTPAVASQVNANFTALKDGVNGVIQSLESTTFSYQKRTTTDLSGVGTSSCASNEIVVSANCNCTGANSTGTNFGTLFTCNVAGNSALGGCYSYLFNASLPPSPIEVTAVCSNVIVSSPLPAAKIPSGPDQKAIDAANILRAQVLEVHETLTNK